MQTRLYKNDASSSNAVSPDFLYDLPDLVVMNSSRSFCWTVDWNPTATTKCNRPEW